MDMREHWEKVYSDKDPSCVSWYEASPVSSLSLIESSSLGVDDSILDVGAGASTLVDELLTRGYEDISVLDVSSRALDATRMRLGAAGERVHWIHENVLTWRPERTWDLWHDRAMLHFLTTDGERSQYVATLRQGLAPGGTAILSTFSLDGPNRCSGLPVTRYSAESMTDLLGPGFELLDRLSVTHATPAGGAQEFLYCRFLRL